MNFCTPLFVIASLCLLATSSARALDETGGDCDELCEAVAAADVIAVGTPGDRYFAGSSGAIGVTIHEIIKGEYKLGRTGLRWDRQHDAECLKDYRADVEYIFFGRLMGSSLFISGFCQHIAEASEEMIERVRKLNRGHAQWKDSPQSPARNADTQNAN